MQTVSGGLRSGSHHNVNTEPCAGQNQNRVPQAPEVHIDGINVEAIERGRFSLRMPLKQGQFTVPGPGSVPAHIRIPENCVASAEVLMGQDANSRPRITSATMDFVPPFVITNPTHALKPTKISCLNHLMDLAADLRVHRIELGSDNHIHVKGQVKMPLFFSDKPLDEAWAAFNPDLESLMAQWVDFDPRDLPEPHMITQYLQHAHEMTRPSTYTLRIRTRPTVMSIGHPNASLKSLASPINVSLRGTMGVGEDSTIHIGITENVNHELVCGAGEMQCHGHMDLVFGSQAGQSVLMGAGRGHVRARLANIRGALYPKPGVHMPIEFGNGDHLTLTAQVNMGFNNWMIEPRSGEVQGQFMHHLSGMVMQTPDSVMQLKTANINGVLGAHLEFVDGNVQCKNISLMAQTDGADPWMIDRTTGKRVVSMPGNFRANVKITRGRFDSVTNALNAAGSIEIEGQPHLVVPGFEQYPEVLHIHRMIHFNVSPEHGCRFGQQPQLTDVEVEKQP